MTTFQEPTNDNGFQDAGATIADAAGVVLIPEFDKIAGNHPSGSGDIDFYELQLASDAGINIELSGASTSLALFNSQGDVLANADNNTINFSGEAGETFFLKVGEELGEDEFTTPAVEEYEIALNLVPNFLDVFDNFLKDRCRFGTENNDTLTGSSKDEVLVGYAGNDIISGKSGNDTLNGGLGADTLKDGFGKDVFYYSQLSESKPGGNRDSIGMNSGIDRIDLSAINADINVSGDQAFVDFIGTDKFTGGVGQVRYDAANNLIQVEIQGDNNTGVDMEIASYSNFSSLSASDFIL